MESTDYFNNKIIGKKSMIKQCLTLKPSYKQFQHFQSYVQKIEKRYRTEHGIVKIIPPVQWISRSSNYKKKLQLLTIKNPETHVLEGKNGIYECHTKAEPEMKLKKYRQLALIQSKHVVNLTEDQKQKKFWTEVGKKTKLYCPNIELTLMDKNSKEWEFQALSSVFSQAVKQKIQGLNTSFCFIGSWGTSFNWHIQDLDLSAINFLHEGQTKVWYGIHPEDRDLFELYAANKFPSLFSKCKRFLRHKSVFIDPYLLLKDIPDLRITKMFQRQNEISIAFAESYHCGFNMGFNIAEAVNYGTLNWIQRYFKYKDCKCQGTNKIDVEYQDIVENLPQSKIYKTIKKNTNLYQYYLKFEKIVEKRKEKDQQVLKDPELLLKDMKNKKIKKNGKLKLGQWSFNLDNQILCGKCNIWRFIDKHTLRAYKHSKFECKYVNKKCFQKYWKQENAKIDSMIIQ